MFKTLKNMFRASKPPEQHFRRPVRARFDAAQTTRDNSKHWAYADQLSADMEASPEVRRTLRMRSRYEVANNSYARGLVQMLANDTIGTGPRLQMLSADETFNDEVERAFMRWEEAVRLAPKLRTMRMARCQDGEAFAVLATNPKVRSPVKLDLMLIEADRVSGGIKLLDDGQSVDGITFDQWGNPTSYRVLKTDDENDLSLLEVELGTGRTHQIRAHLDHLGYPLVGEGKYGVNKEDRRAGFRYQALCSYKTVFESDLRELSYLKGRSFSIPADPEHIPFLSLFEKDG